MEIIGDYRLENMGEYYYIERVKNPHFRITVDMKAEPEIVRFDLIDRPIKLSDIAERVQEIDALLKMIAERHK